jgi:hypothetical protein
MRRDFQAVDSAEMLEIAFARLQSCKCHTMPVIHRGQQVGLLTMDNVGEFLTIQAALGAKGNANWPSGLRPQGTPLQIGG